MTPSSPTTTAHDVEPEPASGPTPAPEESATSRPWGLIAQREIMMKLRDKSFIISTLVTLLLIAGAMGYSAWSAEREDSQEIVATAADLPLAQAAAEQAEDSGSTVTAVEVADADAATAALREGDADAWVHRDGGQWVLTADESVPTDLQALVTRTVADATLADNARSAGVDVDQLRAGGDLRTSTLAGDEAEQDLVANVAGFAMAFLFYFSAILFGMALATSVVEEKQSRIVEIIAAAIPVRQLLIGKIVGNVILAVGQLLLYGVIALIGLSFTPFGDLLPSLTGGIAWFLVYFLAGFTLIAAVFAMAGALASRLEDVQHTATPVTMLLLGMFFVALLAGDGIVEILRWVPPFSAILMPQQLLAGDAAWWQGLLALALLIAATGLVLLAAERIYRRALLQTSGKLSYKEAWNAEV